MTIARPLALAALALTTLGITVVAGFAHSVCASPGAEPPASGADAAVRRIGGDAEARAQWDAAALRWRSGDSSIETALPEGYPPLTPPGAIDLKHYPTVRRAEFEGDGRFTSGGFMPLFQHIQRHGIAMTAPVEMDYPLEAGTGAATGDWTMSFLYRTPDLHPVGSDSTDPRIRIRDVEALTVISLGGRGSYEPARILRDVRTLTEWIEAHPQWQIAGDPRALLYNGPNMRPWLNWLEVQIPVRAAETDDSAESAANPPASE